MTTQNMPVLALRGLTAFPGQTLSFDAEREISILALENAMEGDRELLLVTQREIGVQEPQEEDLYAIGTVCRIFQIVKTSDTGCAGHRRGTAPGGHPPPVAEQALPPGQRGPAGGRGLAGHGTGHRGPDPADLRPVWPVSGAGGESVRSAGGLGAGYPGPRRAGGHHRRQHQPPAPGPPAGCWRELHPSGG